MIKDREQHSPSALKNRKNDNISKYKNIFINTNLSFLNNNQLESLDSNIFVDLEKLVVLFLHYNNIHFLSKAIFESLQKIRIISLYENKQNFPKKKL